MKKAQRSKLEDELRPVLKKQTKAQLADRVIAVETPLIGAALLITTDLTFEEIQTCEALIAGEKVDD